MCNRMVRETRFVVITPGVGQIHHDSGDFHKKTRILDWLRAQSYIFYNSGQGCKQLFLSLLP